MKGYLKQLLGESAIYGLSGVITSFIGMFLMPLYTSVFQPSDYGIIALMGTTSALVTIVLVFGLDNAAALWYWDKTEEADRKRTISGWYFFLLVVSICAGLLFILLPYFFSKLILKNSNYYEIVLVFGFNVLFIGFQKVANIWFRVRRKPLSAVTYSLTISLITIFLNILFVLVIGIGLIGIFYAQLIASAVGFFITTFTLRNWVSYKYFDFKFLKEMLRFSLPLIPAGIVFWLMSSAATYFIVLFVSNKTEVGLFQVGATIASVLGLATWAFLQAWPPFALSIHKNSEAPRVFGVVFELYSVFGLFCAFSLLLFAKEILFLFTNEAYYGAENIIGLLAINVILVGMPSIISIGNNIRKKNMPYASAVFVGSAITLGLFAFLIPSLGKEGAAISMIVGNCAVVIFLGIRTQKIYYVPYNFRRIVSMIFLQGVVFIGLWQFVDEWTWKCLGVVLIGTMILFVYAKRSIFTIFQERDFYSNQGQMEEKVKYEDQIG